jgi:hypothetical protein
MRNLRAGVGHWTWSRFFWRIRRKLLSWLCGDCTWRSLAPVWVPLSLVSSGIFIPSTPSYAFEFDGWVFSSWKHPIKHGSLSSPLCMLQARHPFQPGHQAAAEACLIQARRDWEKQHPIFNAPGQVGLFQILLPRLLPQLKALSSKSILYKHLGNPRMSNYCLCKVQTNIHSWLGTLNSCRSVRSPRARQHLFRSAWN